MATVSDAWLGAYKSRWAVLRWGAWWPLPLPQPLCRCCGVARRRLLVPNRETKFRALLLERHSRAPQRECDEVVVPPTRRRLARKCAPWRGSLWLLGDDLVDQW